MEKIYQIFCQKFLDFKSKRDKAIFALMVTAGLRAIEVARANVGDIIEQGGKYFLLVQGKGHKEKDAMVKISDGVYTLIQSVAL